MREFEEDRLKEKVEIDVWAFKQLVWKELS